MVAESITWVRSKLGIKTCRNVFYKSYATGLIPVRNGKGVRGPPLFDFITPLTLSSNRCLEWSGMCDEMHNVQVD